MNMSDEQLKQELEKILPGLDESVMFENTDPRECMDSEP